MFFMFVRSRRRPNGIHTHVYVGEKDIEVTGQPIRTVVVPILKSE